MVELEAKHFPLVLLDLGGSERTPEELRSVFVGFQEVNRLARAERKRWVLVATTDSPPNAVERKIIAEESNKFSKEDHALTLTSVLVIPNGIIRSVVTAISWMLRSTAPIAAAPTISAAVDLAVDRLRSNGFALPQLQAEHAKRWFLRKESIPRLRTAAGDGKGAR